MKHSLLLSSLLTISALNALVPSASYNLLRSLRSNCKVDFVNSRVVLPAPNSTVSGSNVTVVGILRDKHNKPVANTEVIVSVDNKAVAVVTTNDQGIWTYRLRPGLTLSNGQHTISAADAKCHVCIQPVTFNVNSSLASKVSTRVCNVNTSNSSIAYPYNDAYINSTTPSVVGLLYDNSFNPVVGETVVIKEGTTVLGTVTSDSNGVFSYQLTSSQALSEGQHTFTATACTTPTVNLSPVTFTVDVTAPAAPVITSHSVSGNQVTLNGTSESFATIFVYVDGSEFAEITYADENGNWTIDLFLSSGNHCVKTQAIDLAFNESGLSSNYCFNV